MRNCLRFGHEALLLLLSTIHEQADNLASLYYEYTTEKLTGIFSVEQYLDCLFGGNFKRHKMSSIRSDNHNPFTRYHFHLSMTNDIC